MQEVIIDGDYRQKFALLKQRYKNLFSQSRFLHIYGLQSNCEVANLYCEKIHGAIVKKY